MSFQITQVQVNKHNSGNKDDKILAFAKITICECFCVDGLKVINGEKGVFIGMPSRKQKDGNYRDVAFPTNKETRKLITEAVMKEYNKESDDIWSDD